MHEERIDFKNLVVTTSNNNHDEIKRGKPEIKIKILAGMQFTIVLSF